MYVMIIYIFIMHFYVRIKMSVSKVVPPNRLCGRTEENKKLFLYFRHFLKFSTNQIKWNHGMKSMMVIIYFCKS